MKTLTRREFIRDSARAAATLTAAAAGGLATASCAAGKYDLMVRGAVVYDGTGAAGREADLGIVGDRIVKIGRLAARASGRVIDARGLAAAPGFIDIHDHTAEGLLVDPRAESAVRQGVTMLVGGNCGDSVFPLTEEEAAETGRRWREEFGLDLSWRDAAGFFSRLEASGLALNFGSLVGHGSVRAAVMGYGNRRPTEAELEEMKARVRESLRQGAFGMSSGLEYTPGSFAAEDELVELCRVVRETGGFYATHMRDEEDKVLEALDEAIRIARAAGVPLQVSHLKVGYAVNWPKFDDLIGRVEAARREGLDILCDRYPYIAWATGLSTFFPLWAREGETRDFIARLKDPALDGKLRSELAAAGTEPRRLGSRDGLVGRLGEPPRRGRPEHPGARVGSGERSLCVHQGPARRGRRPGGDDHVRHERGPSPAADGPSARRRRRRRIRGLPDGAAVEGASPSPGLRHVPARAGDLCPRGKAHLARRDDSENDFRAGAPAGPRRAGRDPGTAPTPISSCSIPPGSPIARPGPILSNIPSASNMSSSTAKSSSIRETIPAACPGGC